MIFIHDETGELLVIDTYIFLGNDKITIGGYSGPDSIIYETISKFMPDALADHFTFIGFL